MKKKKLKEIEIYNPPKNKINKIIIKSNDIFENNDISNTKISKRATFYSLKRNCNDLCLTKEMLKEKLKKIIDNKRKKTKSLNLDSLIIKNLSKNNNNILRSNSQINIIENKIKIPNQTTSVFFNQSNNNFRIKDLQNIIFENLLNKRINMNKSKIPKLELDKINTIENIKKIYGKNIFSEKHEKRYHQKERPLKYLINNHNKIKSLNFRNNKNKNKILNKPTYEIIEFGDKKLIYANKLKIEKENFKKFNNKLDCQISKYPNNFYNISLNSDNISNNIISSLSSDRFKSSYFHNYFIKLKNNKNIKNIHNKNNDDIKYIKLKNYKGLEKMKKDEYNNLQKSFIKNSKIIKTNRIKYNSFIENIAKDFNKYEEEIYKENLYL